MKEFADYLSPGDLAGHVSYALIAISYYATSIYWLRMMAVAGLMFEILYFSLSGGAMYTGMAWGVVFILINVYQVQRLIRERMNLRRMCNVALLRQGAFAGLDNAQLSRLVTAGSWRSFKPGTRLTRQGKPVAELVLLCAGSAWVEVDGKTVAQLHAGTFCGEMAFISGEHASATVTVHQPVRAFVFDANDLRSLVDEDELVASAIHHAVGRDLTQKMNRNNLAAVRPG
jgi:Cyclic nucleotide-binding domain